MGIFLFVLMVGVQRVLSLESKSYCTMKIQDTGPHQGWS